MSCGSFDVAARVVPRQRAGDVRVVGVRRRVRPQVVVLGHEAVNERGVVGEVRGLVDVVQVRRGVDPRVGAEVGAAELHDALPAKEHQLVVHDAARRAPSHRDAGGLQLGESLRVELVRVVRAQVHDDPHLDAGLEPVSQLGRVPGVFHEPEADVDALRLVSDVVDENGAAVFVRGIAQAIQRAGRRGGHSESGNQNSDHQSDATFQVRHKKTAASPDFRVSVFCLLRAGCHGPMRHAMAPVCGKCSLFPAAAPTRLVSELRAVGSW